MATTTKKISNAFIIGLFVIIGSVLIIASLIWLGSHQFMKEQKLYVTYFDGSVEGLEQGSAVKYLGVPCGRVKEINVAPGGKLVEVVMQMDPNVKIYDSLRAKSEYAGIAGGKFIQLHVPTDQLIAEMYPRINFSTRYPIIKSAPSGLDEMTLAARDVMNSLMKLNTQGISDELIRLLGSSSNVLESPKITNILGNLDKSMQKISNLMVKADSSRIIEDISATTARLSRTSENLEAMVNNLNNQVTELRLPFYFTKAYNTYDSTMANANRILGMIGYRTENAIMGLNETFHEFRTTNKELQRSLRAISDNPSAVFFSSPPPKEK